LTVAAEDDTRLVGFVQVVLDDDDRWGSLIDNLHITQDRRRTGIGTAFLTCAAVASAERATGKSMYLWVLEQNTAAQQFYRAFGGTCIENAMVSPRGGVPARLNGSPNKLRFTWPDASLLACTTGHSFPQTDPAADPALARSTLTRLAQSTMALRESAVSQSGHRRHRRPSESH
jgi:Acetyltransferase (GNAT) family